MTDIRLSHSRPLMDQVYKILLNAILEGNLQPGSQLPSENELARIYNVRRPTIRGAVTRLAQLGYVIKKQGVGTFVTDTPNIVNPLFLSYNVMDRIAARGYTPGFRQVEAKIIYSDCSISEKLDIPTNSKLLNIHKVFTADTIPIIYFENFIPDWVYRNCLSDEEAMQPGTAQPLFSFLGDQCNHEIKFLTSIIQPKTLKECKLPSDFDVYDPNTNVLVVEDIGYNAFYKRIFLSIEHLLREASIFHVVRHVAKI